MRQYRLTSHAVFVRLWRSEKYIAKYVEFLLGLASPAILIGRDMLTDLLDSYMVLRVVREISAFDANWSLAW